MTALWGKQPSCSLVMNELQGVHPSQPLDASHICVPAASVLTVTTAPSGCPMQREFMERDESAAGQYRYIA